MSKQNKPLPVWGDDAFMRAFDKAMAKLMVKAAKVKGGSKKTK